MDDTDDLSPVTLPKTKTGPRCSVMNCRNKARQKTSDGVGLSFHRFPKDDELREKWIQRCRPLSYANILNRLICSQHFEPHLITKKSKPGSKAKLIEGALPTLFLPAPAGESQLYVTNVPAEETFATESERLYENDIEMVELSSDEDVLVVDEDPPSRELTSEAIALESSPPRASLAVPGERWSSSATTASSRKSTPKRNSTDKSPSKSSLGADSDYEYEDEEIILVPSEELDHIDLQDPLESAYNAPIWKNMNEKARRATLRAYFSRIGSFLPSKYMRHSKMAILVSAVQYLHKVTRQNVMFSIEEEMLLQRHYLLRKKKARLDSLVAKKQALT